MLPAVRIRISPAPENHSTLFFAVRTFTLDSLIALV
jgi:hypothetical protein